MTGPDDVIMVLIRQRIAAHHASKGTPDERTLLGNAAEHIQSATRAYSQVIDQNRTKQ